MSVTSSRAVSMMIGTWLCLRISLQIVSPSVPGSMMSRTTRSGLTWPNRASACDAVPHSLDLVALARQVEARELDDVVLVVDDQDLGAHSGHTINTSPSGQRLSAVVMEM